jgi:uncharacterized oligopeptide transporter (OPT) family protein
MLGVVVSAFFMPPILSLLHTAYGFGPNGLLPAPQVYSQTLDWKHLPSLDLQASLMASVSEGVILVDRP